MYSHSKDVFDKTVDRVRTGLDNGTWIQGESVTLTDRKTQDEFHIVGRYGPKGGILDVKNGVSSIYKETRSKNGDVISKQNYDDVSDFIGNTQSELYNSDLYQHHHAVVDAYVDNHSFEDFELPSTWWNRYYYENPNDPSQHATEISDDEFKSYVNNWKREIPFVNINNPQDTFSVPLTGGFNFNVSGAVPDWRLLACPMVDTSSEAWKNPPSNNIYLRSDVPGDYVTRQSQTNGKEYVTGMAVSEDGSLKVTTFPRTFGDYTFNKSELQDLLHGQSVDVMLRSGERSLKLGTYEKNGEQRFGVMFDDAAKQRDVLNVKDVSEYDNSMQIE